MAAARRGMFSRGSLRRWVRLGVLLAALMIALPVVLTILYLPPVVRPISTLMIKDVVTLQGYDRQWVPLDDIAPVMAHSVIMSEDGQFCAHRGVDLGELRGVISDALDGESTRGASTIPMQTVKNLYLWNGRSFLRKALELPLAIYFDALMPKRRIMEIYLNIAEWGPNIYGVEAASQHYFGKPASQLSRRQAALLAVTLPNPAARNPAKPGPGLRRLASLIERRATKAGAYVQCLN
ncbi:monofunctional biosynthetic peptidoglycan transglycosylase [Aminobacter sp. MDW-2]|uniref:monofunctional biosynthetic peptidoglycan transglycosylase n=1 Tax=Aminobacter sp. MDW-2 TaxID=2666139 RepID=UPI00163C6C7A|nr:monofunctional biosynthetic peptidoglycan transglycosylase [Aminobacter sp. MDW-2]QNH37076.1 monofunctional biosynthetic peptidoglycan transglycosylase [Aminobacter sp. MDW-2]